MAGKFWGVSPDLTFINKLERSLVDRFSEYLRQEILYISKEGDLKILLASLKTSKLKAEGSRATSSITFTPRIL